ncbi:hypothetical protein SIN8267_02634 [Sinobacterium norvegicum]|uniref:Chromosome partitioning protein ParA n=1 Tax=Sinobacterium norvegicum TaxID=1641715 RepID=A0ABM9AH12_9GAMM|nr:hypothetical protein [Sinobacterium norvegicum]CAH0992502.1 hypothetical protein SIN8267_02634 [Sinobacterium norvegicum]
MFQSSQQEDTGAVLFFKGPRVVKEMLYPEFEAVLDNVVGLSDYSSQRVKAVYLRINGQLNITGAVFFCIEFNAEGEADKQWNIPFIHLLETASTGPDMGAGPIKLACFSQCPVNWMSAQMWDPDLGQQHNSFAILRDVVSSNRLGLVRQLDAAPAWSQPTPGKPLFTRSDQSDTVEPPVLDASSQVLAPGEQQLASGAAHQEQLSTLFKANQLQLSTLKAEQNQQLVDIHHHYKEQLAELQQQLQAETDSLLLHQEKNERLEQLQQQQLREFTAARETSQRQMLRARKGDSEKISQLKQQFAAETKAAVSAALAPLTEQLEQAKVEELYRRESNTALLEQIEQLQADKQRLFVEGGDQLLAKLVRSGIHFVAFQPGAGEMSIDIEQLSDYLEAPDVFAAQHCDCDLDRYRDWLSHFQAPICNEVAGGNRCGKPVARVDMPSYFIGGETDRCSSHTLSAKTVSKIMFGGR